MKVLERVRDATEALKSSEAVKQVSSKARAQMPSLGRQLFSYLVLFAIVAGVLVAWNWAQNRDDVRDRLWGELAFFGLVIALGIAVISPWIAYGTRRLPGRLDRYLEISPIPAHQALAWGAITVVAFPIAMMQRPEGFAVLIVCTITAAVFFGILGRRYPWFPGFALCWAVVVGLFVLAGYTSAFYGGPVKDFSLAAAEPAVPGAEDLARRFRPLLFFDRDERYQPIDIVDAEVVGCRSGLSIEDCGDPVNPMDSLDDYAYIKVDGPEMRRGESPGGPASAYYYHAVKRDSNVHLDYWWYFEHNPSPFGEGVLCGQALRWLGEACAEHPADWEGITVVLAPCEAAARESHCAIEDNSYRISEVHYAQHEKVVSYSWDVLRKEWEKPAYAEWSLTASNRPLVFTALDSHASYAVPCALRCKQIAHPRFTERRDGKLHWSNNDAAGCDPDCLQELPVAEGEPSAWNAFPGPWGAQFCILFGSYCDVRPAPAAPGFQKRFKDPQCDPKRCLRRDTFTPTGDGSAV